MRRSMACGVSLLVFLLGALALAPAASPAAVPPSAATGAATGVTDTRATLSGTVNPHGQETTFRFQYGTTTAYGKQTPPAAAGSGSGEASVSAFLSGLAPGTTYHYRLSATNASGTTVGADRTFTTIPAPRLALFGRTAFVEQHGIAGVFVACIGDVPCSGNLKLTRFGTLLGQRGRFSLSANDGGFVHFRLGSLGRALLRRRGVLPVRATVTDAYGRTSSRHLNLLRFPRFGLRG
jgi:hypothetical protein